MSNAAGAREPVVFIGGYQCVDVKHVDDIDLATFAQGERRYPMKVVDSDGRELFRIELPDEET